MTNLGLNVDHVATVRQARGGREPDPVTVALTAELCGAAGITVHLREDRRHIQDRDVCLLREAVQTTLNLEMAATEEMVGIAIDTRPDQSTLVPEKREELTTEGGLDVLANRDAVASAVERLRKAGIVVSLFIDPDDAQIDAARDVGADAIEIHTGVYANAKPAERASELERLRRGAERAHAAGLRVHAGHGLDYHNVVPVARLPHVEDLNIGHSIISRAIHVGIERAVSAMVDLIR